MPKDLQMSSSPLDNDIAMLRDTMRRKKLHRASFDPTYRTEHLKYSKVYQQNQPVFGPVMKKNTDIRNPRDAHIFPPEKLYKKYQNIDSILFSREDLEEIKKGNTESDKYLASLLEPDLTKFLLDHGQYHQAQRETVEMNKLKLKRTEKPKKVTKKGPSKEEKELSKKHQEAMFALSPETMFDRFLFRMAADRRVDREMQFVVMQKVLTSGLLDSKKPTTILGK